MKESSYLHFLKLIGGWSSKLLKVRNEDRVGYSIDYVNILSADCQTWFKRISCLSESKKPLEDHFTIIFSTIPLDAHGWVSKIWVWILTKGLTLFRRQDLPIYCLLVRFSSCLSSGDESRHSPTKFACLSSPDGSEHDYDHLHKREFNKISGMSLCALLTETPSAVFDFDFFAQLANENGLLSLETKLEPFFLDFDVKITATSALWDRDSYIDFPQFLSPLIRERCRDIGGRWTKKGVMFAYRPVLVSRALSPPCHEFPFLRERVHCNRRRR